MVIQEWQNFIERWYFLLFNEGRCEGIELSSLAYWIRKIIFQFFLARCPLKLNLPCCKIELALVRFIQFIRRPGSITTITDTWGIIIQLKRGRNTTIECNKCRPHYLILFILTNSKFIKHIRAIRSVLYLGDLSILFLISYHHVQNCLNLFIVALALDLRGK